MIIVLGLALIIAFMIADAILDWVFVAVYALLGMAILNDLIHLFKYYRKYNEINVSDIGRIFFYFVITAIVIALQAAFI